MTNYNFGGILDLQMPYTGFRQAGQECIREREAETGHSMQRRTQRRRFTPH